MTPAFMSDPTPPTLTGHIDQADRHAVTGWAMDPARPGEPVLLEVVLDGEVVGSFPADRHRADLEQAGLGDGRHAFQLQIPGGLSPHAERVLELRRAGDGAIVPGSPVVLPRAPLAGEAARRALHDAVEAAVLGADAPALEALIGELVRAIQARDPSPPAHHAALLARFGAAAPAPEPRRRALILDESIPDPGRDAGSSALLSHMRSLHRLGFAVEIVPGFAMAADAAAVARMEAEGFTAWVAPWASSVEEVLRRGGEAYDVVYVHRLAVMLKYGALIRRWCPRARLVYCVADLHHLRAEREAALVTGIAGNPEIEALREAELSAIAAADGPITHSTAEQARLAALLPGVRVHVVPWEVALPPPVGPATRRRGVAFVGSFGHAPNRDAAWELLEAVMPLVWAQDATIPFLLAGSGMPAELAEAARTARGPVEVLGRIPVLAELWGRALVAAAPLRFGAGIKGKVLDSLAAGIPCLCTTIAAEGLHLPDELATLVQDEPGAMAREIVRLHQDPALVDRLGAAGRAHIGEHYRAAVIDEALAPALGLETT
jgi:glycosyltransferase involved in cell wall biosynthesis